MFATNWKSRFSLVALIAVVALAGCGDDDSGSSGQEGKGDAPKVSRDDKVAALVPAAVKEKGTLTVATDATYAPMEFQRPGTKDIVGMDPDLAKALGTTMGLKMNVVNATFDAILPGLQAKKYDLAMSSMTDNAEREKVVDFVTYFSAGTSFYVKAQGGPAINTIEDICGRTLAIQKGTIQVDDAEAQNKKCDEKAKILTFTEQTAANLALSSDRAEVGMADSPVAAYQVRQTKGQFKLSGKPYGTAPYGIAIPKDSGMEKALLAGVKALMANGAYDAILKRWGLTQGAIDNPQINGAID